MAPYKIQIKIIEYTKELGIPVYDFGGYVVEYIGEFDLILKFIGYNVYDKGYDVYREIRNLAAKIIKLTK